jgi:hypothetical protein
LAGACLMGAVTRARWVRASRTTQHMMAANRTYGAAAQRDL